MVIVIIGPSGSGKDTQADLLVDKYGIPNISTGRIMREEIAAGTGLGEQINEYVSKGKWLPDELAYELLQERVLKPDAAGGFILNGYPRTFKQVALLDKLLAKTGVDLKAVVHFNLDEDELLKRMSKQTTEATARPDMNMEAMRARLDSYNSTIEPILAAYKEKGVLLDIDASPSIEAIHQDIIIKLEGPSANTQPQQASEVVPGSGEEIDLPSV